uniref:Uncharacterized protein n=1 Tax=Anguilla anguilla TaxID=7936 RepID=A0A0E9UMU4_ANGAN
MPLGFQMFSVHLPDAHALGAVAVQVTHGVQAHITETLNDKSLVREAGGEAQLAHVRRLVDEVLDAVENPRDRWQRSCRGSLPG